MADKRKKTYRMQYYLTPMQCGVPDLAGYLTDYRDRTEIWTEMGVMEIRLEQDALTVEEASEEFDSPEDQAYLKKHGIRSIYAFTYETGDQEEAEKILRTIKEHVPGRLCQENEKL